MSATAPSTAEEATTPILTIDGARATIRLNRPAKLNRIEPADLVALRDHLQSVEAAPDVRVLIFTGTGRVFSAGYHLGDLDDRQAGRDRPNVEQVSFEAVADALEDCRVPTICALNGSVYGGSTDLALACDFRIGIVGSEMLMPAGKLGVHYYLSGMRRYVSRLGLGAAKRLFLTARPIDSDEMASLYQELRARQSDVEADRAQTLERWRTGGCSSTVAVAASDWVRRMAFDGGTVAFGTASGGVG